MERECDMSDTKETRARILLVEDDLKLADLVREYLEGHGFEVLLEARGDRAEERIFSERPDLVILDLMLPGMDGLTICKRVRPEFKNPILMLTARSEEVDEIVGLEVGADDYLAKPVRPRLLVARINTLLRRTLETERGSTLRADEPETTPSDPSENVIALGDLVVDAGSRTARLKGDELPLTTVEFDLLLFLARHPGEVLERERLYRELRGIEWDGLDRAMDLRVARLRKKLGDDARNPRRIKSVHGTGYLLAVMR